MDIVEIVKALPKESINEITKVACDTFRKIVYPLTATTKGIGLLIETKFNTLSDAQKILAAEAVKIAAEKVASGRRAKSCSINMKPIIFYEALENIDNHVEELQREIWTNVIAREIQTGDVHPEIARILSKLATQDILLLNNIAFNQNKDSFIRFLAHFKNDEAVLSPVKNSFNHFYLEELGLIVKDEGKWNTTYKGIEVLNCVEPL
jgi:hypothetical protein